MISHIFEGGGVPRFFGFPFLFIYIVPHPHLKNLSTLPISPNSWYNLPMEDIYKKYVKWCALPQTKRKPRTTATFIEDNEITKQDILDFQASPNFQADVAVATFKWAKERVPEMLHKLHENASTSGKADVIKAYLDVIKEEEKEQDKIEDIISITIFTDEQRKQIIDRITGRGGFDMPSSEEEPANV